MSHTYYVDMIKYCFKMLILRLFTSILIRWPYHAAQHPNIFLKAADITYIENIWHIALCPFIWCYCRRNICANGCTQNASRPFNRFKSLRCSWRVNHKKPLVGIFNERKSCCAYMPSTAEILNQTSYNINGNRCVSFLTSYCNFNGTKPKTTCLRYGNRTARNMWRKLKIQYLVHTHLTSRHTIFESKLVVDHKSYHLLSLIMKKTNTFTE